MSASFIRMPSRTLRLTLGSFLASRTAPATGVDVEEGQGLGEGVREAGFELRQILESGKYRANVSSSTTRNWFPLSCVIYPTLKLFASAIDVVLLAKSGICVFPVDMLQQLFQGAL